jgi:hypothetical protein
MCIYVCMKENEVGVNGEKYSAVCVCGSGREREKHVYIYMCVCVCVCVCVFDFVLFYCFQILNKHAINSIDFGLKAHHEKT